MKLLAALLALPVHLYRLTLRHLLAPRCRFHPSCSTYALEALSRHGPFRGSRLALGRILRCHPLSSGGFDPVPAELARRNN